MEIARKLLIIYYRKNNVIPKLAKHGNLIYTSKRNKYAYLYVNAKNSTQTMEAIKRLNGVSKVEESLIDMDVYNFSL